MSKSRSQSMTPELLQELRTLSSQFPAVKQFTQQENLTSADISTLRNINDGKFNTLQYSILQGHVALFKTLLKGADVNYLNASSPSGLTALHCIYSSTLKDKHAALSDLLKAGTDPNLQHRTNHKTPLHFAADTLDLEGIKLLLAHAADPDIKVDKKNLFLEKNFTALSDSFLQEVSYLDILSRSKIPAQNIVNIFVDLANYLSGNFTTTARILNASLNASSEETQNYVLEGFISEYFKAINQINAASSKSNPDNYVNALTKITLLADIISSINKMYAPALFDALMNYTKTLAPEQRLQALTIAEGDPGNLFVANNPLPEIFGTKIQALNKSISAEEEKQRKIEKKAFPLHETLKNNENIEAFLKKNPDIDVNAKNSNGETPMAIAFQQGQWNNLIILLNMKASTHVVDPKNPNKNILQLAIETNNLQIVSDTLAALKSNHALDVALLPDKDGRSAYHAAITGGNTAILKAILDAGESSTFGLKAVAEEGTADMLQQVFVDRGINRLIDPNFKPIHAAAASGNISNITEFLKLNADPLAETRNDNYTFLEAYIIGGYEIENLLKALNKTLFFPSDRVVPNQDSTTKPSLVNHLFQTCLNDERLITTPNMRKAITEIAKLNPEGFYKEFKTEAARLRAASNSNKIKTSEKVNLLQKQRTLCQLVLNAEVSALRGVKLFNTLFKDELNEQLTNQIQLLDRKIAKLNTSHRPQ